MSSTNFEATSGASAPGAQQVPEVAARLSPDLRRCLTTETMTAAQRDTLVSMGLLRAQQNALGSTFWWFTTLGDAVRAYLVLENGRNEG